MYLNRAKQIVPRIEDFLNPRDTILDIGCGTGSIGKVLKAKNIKNLTLADVQYNVMCDQYPVIIYDGQKLPFKNNQFTTSLLITVLHHCDDSSKVIDEAKRVSSKRIIIMEDVFTDVLGRVVTFIGDCLVNWEIHSPFRNHSTKDWIEIFRKKGLKVEQVNEFKLRCIGLPFKLAIFVLTK